MAACESGGTVSVRSPNPRFVSPRTFSPNTHHPHLPYLLHSLHPPQTLSLHFNFLTFHLQCRLRLGLRPWLSFVWRHTGSATSSQTTTRNLMGLAPRLLQILRADVVRQHHSSFTLMRALTHFLLQFLGSLSKMPTRVGVHSHNTTFNDVTHCNMIEWESLVPGRPRKRQKDNPPPSDNESEGDAASLPTQHKRKSTSICHQVVY